MALEGEITVAELLDILNVFLKVADVKITQAYIGRERLVFDPRREEGLVKELVRIERLSEIKPDSRIYWEVTIESLRRTMDGYVKFYVDEDGKTTVEDYGIRGVYLRSPDERKKETAWDDIKRIVDYVSRFLPLLAMFVERVLRS